MECVTDDCPDVSVFLELYKIAVTLHVYGIVGDVCSRGKNECCWGEKCLERKKRTFCVQHILSECMIVLGFYYYYYYFLCLCSPARAVASSFHEVS
jgi:hypothetical protein